MMALQINSGYWALARRVIPTFRCFRSLAGALNLPSDEVGSEPSISVEEFREHVSSFAERIVAPHAADIDAQNTFPRNVNLWTEMGQMGLHGVTVPERYGGLGLGYLHHVIAMEEISRRSGAVALSYGAHSNLCISQLVRHGTDAQLERYLPPLLSGEAIGALSMSEANSGSDVVSLRTMATRHGDRFVLNGNKMWCTNGPTASTIIVYAKTDPTAAKHGITAFILEKGMPGLSAAQKLDKLGPDTCPLLDRPMQPAAVRAFSQYTQLQSHGVRKGLQIMRKCDSGTFGAMSMIVATLKCASYRSTCSGPSQVSVPSAHASVCQCLCRACAGMRGSDTCELVLDHVTVPMENVLGEVNKGVYVLMSGLDYERLVLSGGPIGLMQACMDTALPYVRERTQFGKPIGSFQLIQAKLADIYVALEASRSLSYRTAQALDRGEMVPKDCAAAILHAAEHATQCTLQAIQILGGNGYVNEYCTGRLLRDAKLYEIGAGTSEVRRLIIGKALYKDMQPQK